jgi:hypothetical protein
MFEIHLIFPSVGDQNQPFGAASLLLFKPLVNYFSKAYMTYMTDMTYPLTTHYCDHFFKNLWKKSSASFASSVFSFSYSASAPFLSPSAT